MSSQRRKLPRKLKLLPGLRWRGQLTIMSIEPSGYAVAFDAEATDPEVISRFIFDRAVLTAKQIKDWTGWEEQR